MTRRNFTAKTKAAMFLRAESRCEGMVDETGRYAGARGDTGEGWCLKRIDDECARLWSKWLGEGYNATEPLDVIHDLGLDARAALREEPDNG